MTTENDKATDEAQVRSLIEGRWTVTHEHNSVPFDMQTFKALLDLKP